MRKASAPAHAQVPVGALRKRDRLHEVFHRGCDSLLRTIRQLQERCASAIGLHEEFHRGCDPLLQVLYQDTPGLLADGRHCAVFRV